jgi:REP element-mobilizing transposase RayT
VKPDSSSQTVKPTRNPSSVPYNPQLENLVEQEKQWSEPGKNQHNRHGFAGWHQRGYLPHCDAPGLIQLVTIRLHDSLPTSRRAEWESLLKIEDVRERRTRLESYLDRGAGECWLVRPHIAKCAENALRYFDRQRYQLHAWVIMPNHVHILVEIGHTPLAKLVQSWKRFIARESNKILARKKTFWQREYWDTYMRNAAQTLKAVKYIESNPVKAKLVRQAKDWPWGSAKFRDRNGNLALPRSSGL